jgi:selenocysteine insertion sequence-binding protein 2
MRRRYVMGIREVTKHLKLKKVKCIILAPNCEKIQSKGGLDEAINRIIEYSIEQDVPFVFALGRKGLGKAVNKLVPISVIGIFDYGGAEVLL